VSEPPDGKQAAATAARRCDENSLERKRKNSNLMDLSQEKRVISERRTAVLFFPLSKAFPFRKQPSFTILVYRLEGLRLACPATK
jgi:hypothetical protein